MDRPGSLGLFHALMTIGSLQPSTSVDYCDPNLCPPERKHIACGNDMKFNSSCSHDATLVPMTYVLRRFLLDAHNRYRNRVASGRVRGYASARKMPALRWDMELANLAEMNAKTCMFGHDQCRNTDRFRMAGQNLGVQYNNHTKPVTTVIEHLMKMWFDEHTQCDMSYINSYHRHPTGEKIGHFTVMMTDRSTHMGCAVTRYFDPTKQRKATLLACDYSFTNVLGEQIYETGRMCSGCSNGCHKVYRALCK